ncbi:heme ABC transporter ATP-binding protein [Vibrio neptunius]|uniref:Heme ABC transporter ATP-binding protein n=1 Tax=Vibrio neptunius TaxID=170651 RepID=A0ABS3A6V9_9VIBR|nr:heme ABC transporter ATP-binding protein [Vibrio neptunius]MBN3494979.1 heme ABC transporter ATP-binding protein [Vibrio neptunius]MBN3517399.1 heme ABC transporter ATP-binding protein [Vibrio neptunius]MBN3551778.1 heme ABC transporter ATP-binding protein [Vibrio neptunius]MBN3579770.1 heme ABC transporter ATP-binding protein [Vibrio neptunius]MCH9873435.1 heme ABC transporter ATP-binding protein [Vibrio neptunius]
MGEVVLSAKNISISFGQRQVLDKIDIEIKSGEVTALLGPNGAGKSTLLKLLCGEIPSNNDIHYFGQHKKKWAASTLAKHLGMLPQHSTLSFPFLAHEVVELGAIPLNLANKETQTLAKACMKMTDVEHLAQRLYPSLSGGEKQRLHLARVLVQLAHSGDNKILMLDEPTSALDLAHQHNTLKIARQLADQHNTAVVIVLHDLNLAAQYSDRLVVLHNGDVVCDAPPWQALTPEMIASVYGYASIINKHPTMDFPMVYPAA